MNTAWTIYSGGRLCNQIAEHASFRITSDEVLDHILLRSVADKRAFENNLRGQLSRLVLPHSTMSPLSIAFQSAVVVNESARREVEFSVVVIDEVSESMLWYFMLTSPEENISPDDLDEIASLIVNRLYTKITAGTHKDCL